MTVSRQRCCPTTYKSKEEALRLLNEYSPTSQLEWAGDPILCITADVPTLANVRAEYGAQVACDWLLIQLNDYQNFLGIKEEYKADTATLRQVAQMIINRYFFLKLSELLLFLQRLKYGDYVEFYGVVDAAKILKAFKPFLEERGTVIDREQARRRREEYDNYQKKAVSYECYKQLTKQQKESDANDNDILSFQEFGNDTQNTAAF